MKFPTKRISGVADLLSHLREKIDPKRPTWFRGQSNKEWSLTCSLARDSKTASAEAMLIKGFKQNAVAFLTSAPRSEWDWMFVMQHYRLPTRLLDWTESPLTALYFAVEGVQSSADATVWCLDPIGLNKNANISFSFDAEIPAFDHDDILDNYLPSRIARETTSDLSPIAGIACRNSPRISAQLGTFTITHRNHRPIEAVGKGDHVWRLTVPAAKKKAIRDELAILGFSRLTLFPELDQVARRALELLA